MESKDLYDFKAIERQRIRVGLSKAGLARATKTGRHKRALTKQVVCKFLSEASVLPETAHRIIVDGLKMNKDDAMKKARTA